MKYSQLIEKLFSMDTMNMHILTYTVQTPLLVIAQTNGRLVRRTGVRSAERKHDWILEQK